MTAAAIVSAPLHAVPGGARGLRPTVTVQTYLSLMAAMLREKIGGFGTFVRFGERGVAGSGEGGRSRSRNRRWSRSGGGGGGGSPPATVAATATATVAAATAATATMSLGRSHSMGIEMLRDRERGDRTWSRSGCWSRSRGYWPSATAAATANATAAVAATATATTPILVPVVPAVHPGCRPMLTAFNRPSLHGHVLVGRPGVWGETETLSICSAQRAGQRTTCGRSPCTTMPVGKNTLFGGGP